MMIMGNGVANIFRADATNHFGPIIDIKNTVRLLGGFEKTWDGVKSRIRTARADVIEEIEEIEDYMYDFTEIILKGLESKAFEINVSSMEFLSFIRFVYSLRNLDIALSRLPGLRELTKLIEFPPIVYLLKKMWSRRNKEIRRGFDLILTNPPMGRAGRGRTREELLIDDKHILAQYALAQNKWIYSMTQRELREIARRLGVRASSEKQ